MKSKYEELYQRIRLLVEIISVVVTIVLVCMRRLFGIDGITVFWSYSPLWLGMILSTIILMVLNIVERKEDRNKKN